MASTFWFGGFSSAPTNKRARTDEPTVNDVLHYGRLVMENDPFKEKAPVEEDKNFRALFGCGPSIVLLLWNMLQEEGVSPPDGSMEKLLWTLMFCKTYPKWKTMRKLTNTDPKTLRKWIDLFVSSIVQLEGQVVRAI